MGDLATAGYQLGTASDGRTMLTQTFSVDDRRDLIVEIALDMAGEMDILRWQTAPR
jgi:hypothetical protein